MPRPLKGRGATGRRRLLLAIALIVVGAAIIAGLASKPAPETAPGAPDKGRSAVGHIF